MDFLPVSLSLELQFTLSLKAYLPVCHSKEMLLARKLMHQSIRKFNIPPPGNPLGISNFEDWLVQIPSPRGKKAVQMPHQLVLNYLSSRQISPSIKHFTRLLERDMPS